MKPKKSGPAWLEEIVDRVNRAFEKLPIPYWLEGDWPEWVENVGLELTKTFYPTAKLKISKRWEPGEVGAMLGQQIAYFASLENVNAPKERTDWKKLRLVYGKDIKVRVRAYEKKWNERFLPELDRAVKFSLKAAIDQEYVSRSRFFAAFGRAIERKVAAGNGVGRTNTQIYLLLMMAWRSVEKLGSIPALHRALCRIFGTHLVGDVKRIEKMCERIGLSYRGIAARQKSHANSDKNS